jgi:aminopeptidase YwaD
MIPLDSEIGKHLDILVNNIGARPSGSAANHAAADYIQHIFKTAGLAVEEQRFDCMAWTEDETHLTLNGQALAAAANAYSPACDVTAPLVGASSMAELEDADLSGCIALFYDDLTKAPLAAKS